MRTEFGEHLECLIPGMYGGSMIDVHVRTEMVPEISFDRSRAIVAAQGLEGCDAGMRNCMISMRSEGLDDI